MKINLPMTLAAIPVGQVNSTLGKPGFASPLLNICSTH